MTNRTVDTIGDVLSNIGGGLGFLMSIILPSLEWFNAFFRTGGALLGIVFLLVSIVYKVNQNRELQERRSANKEDQDGPES